MASNIHRFRRLKWADPAPKFNAQQPPDEPRSRVFEMSWEWLVIAFILFAVIYSAVKLLG